MKKVPTLGDLGANLKKILTFGDLGAETVASYPQFWRSKNE